MSKLPTPKRAAPPEKSLSNSERQAFTMCRKKWQWTYDERYEPIGTPTPFLVGTAVHEVIAEFYKPVKDPRSEDGELLDMSPEAIINRVFDPVLSGKDNRFLSPEQMEDVAKQKVMTLGMALAYVRVYADDRKKWKVIDVERKGKFRINKNWDMYFTVDMLVKIKGKAWVVEHKTTAVIDANYVSRLDLDDQVTTYLVGVEKTWGIKAEGVIYNVIMKPRIRQKQKETREEYLGRVLALYEDNPQEYLYRAQLYRTKGIRKTFERELDLFTKEMDRAEKLGFYYKNTGACSGIRGTCSMMPLCIEGEKAAKDRFRVRKERSQYDEGE